MKFEYRKSEKQQELSNNSALTLKYSKFFKQNPDLIEFMRVISCFFLNFFRFKARMKRKIKRKKMKMRSRHQAKLTY